MHDISEHQRQIEENLAYWNAKPVLRNVYREFHESIAAHLSDIEGESVELGSGIGNIKDVIPHCVRTDLFPNPWIDRRENAYFLSMGDASVANLILFDVFHHLEYPMSALCEFRRVLRGGGRLIVFDHAMSSVGGFFSRFVHHERGGFGKPWKQEIGTDEQLRDAGYYADHANAQRVFELHFESHLARDWQRVAVVKTVALKWLLSGGYRGPDLASRVSGETVSALQSVLDKAPKMFALRLLVVLEKK
jgi:SAM-dependent methyltransferase